MGVWEGKGLRPNGFSPTEPIPPSVTWNWKATSLGLMLLVTPISVAQQSQGDLTRTPYSCESMRRVAKSYDGAKYTPRRSNRAWYARSSIDWLEFALIPLA